MKFMLQRKTNKDKSTEIFTPIILRCARAMKSAKKGQRKHAKRFQFQRRRQGFAPLEVLTLCMVVSLPGLTATHLLQYLAQPVVGGAASVVLRVEVKA